MGTFTESIVEEAALARFGAIGWEVLHGPEIAFGMPGAERGDPQYRDVVLGRHGRFSASPLALRSASVRLPTDG